MLLDVTDQQGLHDKDFHCHLVSLEGAQRSRLHPQTSKAIENRLAGKRGDALEQAAGEQTNSLQPAHQYVPWVVVNGGPCNPALSFKSPP